MNILSSTPTTVAQAIMPFQKVITNLKAVRAAQQKRTAAAQNKIDAARRTLDITEKSEAAVIDAATSEDVAAARLLKKLEELLSADVPSVAAMKPADKMSAGHVKTKG